MIKVERYIHLALAVAACAIGSGFQHGYNTGVVNNAQIVIENFMNDTQVERNGEGFSRSQMTALWSAVVSIYCIGGMLGGLAVAPVADKCGRKGGLLWNNVLVMVGALLLGCASPAASFEMLFIGRFVMGLNSGINAGLASIYVTEISPISHRGALGSMYQLVITLSILLSQILGLPNCLGTSTLWPLLLALVAGPGILQVILLFFSPESPKYLLLKNKTAQASDALRWLRRTEDVSEELQQLGVEIEVVKNMKEVSFKDLVVRRNLRLPLIIAVCVMLAQQLSGINAVIFFSTNIFRSANLSESHALTATLIMGAVNVVVTVISVCLVEKLGRRPLLIGALAGCSIASILLTVCLALKDQVTWLPYIAALLVYVFIVVFAMGLGSIPWFLVTELFDQQAIAKATSIAVAVNWSANFVVGMAFLPLKDAINEYVFLVFAAILLIFLVFFVFRVPETKGQSIDEILSKLYASMPSTISKQQLNAGISIDTLAPNPS